METHSNRKYKVVLISTYGEVREYLTDLNTLMSGHIDEDDSEDDNIYELMYAIQDKMDDILDLRKGEFFMLSANRDVPEEGKVVIVRTN